MELDYRLPVQFSIQGGRNILVTFSFSATLLIVHKLISPVNWGSAKGTWLAGIPLKKSYSVRTRFWGDPRHIQVILVYLSPHKHLFQRCCNCKTVLKVPRMEFCEGISRCLSPKNNREEEKRPVSFNTPFSQSVFGHHISNSRSKLDST